MRYRLYQTKLVFAYLHTYLLNLDLTNGLFLSRKTKTHKANH